MKTWSVVAIALAGCQGALDQRLAIVREPRVLAIVAEPPEADPEGDVALTALVAGPSGPLAEVPAWSLCDAPKPPTEDNAISDACLGDASLVPIGTGATVTSTIPMDACLNYGPDVASARFRPRDPDPTGGYYQPVRADIAGLDLAFGFPRITCDLAAAPGDLAEQYKQMYVANVNPTLDPVALDPVAAGATITLTAGWPAAAAESYLYFDPESQMLVTRRESMLLSWFATGGSLAVDASAVDETDPSTSVSTTWHAPSTPGPAWLWLVLRDSRGGIATQTIAVTVQ